MTKTYGDDRLTVFNSEYSMMSIRQPTTYKWAPQEDITTYELALCVPVFGMSDLMAVSDYINDLPECARRHFEAD